MAAKQEKKKGAGGPKNISPAQYAEAIRKANGLISVAASSLGVARSSVYDASREHPEVQQAIEDARERTIDLAEGKLMSKINEGDNTAIIFFLKTIGKSRGYVERQEVTGADGQGLQVEVTRRVVHGDAE